MGCSCGKSKKTTRRSLPPSRIVGSRNNIESQSIQDQNTVSAQNLTPTPVRSASGLSAERRLIEKRRRDAIRKALGK